MADELHLFRGSDSPLEPDFLMHVRKLLQLPQEARLELSNLHDDPNGGCSLDYSVTVSVQLNGPEYGVADGVTVDEQTSASLSFDALGNLVSTRYAGIEGRRIELIRDQVKKLAAAGQIALTRSEATPGSGKPWYLEQDTQGVRRVKRARMD